MDKCKGVLWLRQVPKRGFYPKGNGQVRLTVPCLKPGHKLPAFDLRERGDILGVRMSAFRTGRVPEDAADRMASAAASTLREASS